MDANSVLTTILPAVIAAIGGWIASGVTSKKNKSDTESKLREDLMSRLDSVCERVDILEKENLQLKEDILNYKHTIKTLEDIVKDGFDHISLMEAFYAHMPNPAWLKNKEGVMFFINQAYEKEWGISKLKYEGKKDETVWPLDSAREFRNSDKQVLTSMKGMSFIEQVPDNPEDPNTTYTDWHVWKWPVVYKGEVIGVGGWAVKGVGNAKFKRVNNPKILARNHQRN